MQAVINDNLEAVKAILDLNNKEKNLLFDINAKDQDDQTPLMAACTLNKVEMAKLLIAKGADVDVQNNENETALIAQCKYYKSLEMAKLLIDNKANINIKDNQEESAYDYLVYSMVTKVREKGEVESEETLVKLAEKIKSLHTMELPIDTKILTDYEPDVDMEHIKNGLKSAMQKDIATRTKILTDLKENPNLSEEIKKQIKKIEKETLNDESDDSKNLQFDDTYDEYCKISQIQKHAEKEIQIHDSVKEKLKEIPIDDLEEEKLDDHNELLGKLSKTLTSIHRGNGSNRLSELHSLHNKIQAHGGSTEELKQLIVGHKKTKKPPLIVALVTIAAAAATLSKFLGTGI